VAREVREYCVTTGFSSELPAISTVPPPLSLHSCQIGVRHIICRRNACFDPREAIMASVRSTTRKEAMAYTVSDEHGWTPPKTLKIVRRSLIYEGVRINTLFSISMNRLTSQSFRKTISSTHQDKISSAI
jgi:hypothetical protein